MRTETAIQAVSARNGHSSPSADSGVHNFSDDARVTGYSVSP